MVVEDFLIRLTPMVAITESFSSSLSIVPHGPKGLLYEVRGVQICYADNGGAIYIKNGGAFSLKIEEGAK